MFNSPGTLSHQLLHYLDVHLNDRSIDTVIIHIVINALLINSTSGMNDRISNIKKITEKCLMFGVKNVFVLRLVYTTRVGVFLLERVHVLIYNLSRKNCFVHIDNRNIRGHLL